MMRLLPVTALLTTCAALLLAGCDNEDPPGIPDAGTQEDAGTRDTEAPTLTGSTPAADQAHVDASTDITVRFSEDMKPGVGTVRIRAEGAQRALRGAHWETARAYRVHPAEPLPAGAQVEVTVEADFEDVAGNRLAAPRAFRFTVHGPQVPRPHVTASSPAEGATNVMPVELYKAGATSTGLRKVLTLTFNAPMDTTVAQVTLSDVTTPANPARALTGTWSQDGLTLTLVIPRPEPDLPPLEQENGYSLDVTGLRSAAGGAVDASHAGLGNGKLDFTTGRRNPEVEHACLHALVSEPEAVTAGGSPSGFMPATDRGHVFYALTLPASGAESRGYTEVVTAPDRDQTFALYLNQPVPVAVHDATEGEDAVASTLEPAAPVCVPAITHVLKFAGPGRDRFLRLTFGPTPHRPFTFVFERY